MNYLNLLIIILLNTSDAFFILKNITLYMKYPHSVENVVLGGSFGEIKT